jgi:hypothetical protein
MTRDRFWFGTALVVGPLIVLLMVFGPGSQARRGGPIEGRVSVRGRPLAGGYIMFVPVDNSVNTAVGVIDAKGHYAIPTKYRPEQASHPTHYRICVIPKAGGAFWRVSDVANAPGTVETRSSVGSVKDPRGTVGAPLPVGFADPLTTQLEVHLDSSPAQVDVAL